MADKKPTPRWVPYFKPLESDNESGWRNFEIGYRGPQGSRLVLNRCVDVIELSGAAVRLDHEDDEIMVSVGRGPQCMRWKDPWESSAKLVVGSEALIVEERPRPPEPRGVPAVEANLIGRYCLGCEHGSERVLPESGNIMCATGHPVPNDYAVNCGLFEPRGAK